MKKQWTCQRRTDDTLRWRTCLLSRDTFKKKKNSFFVLWFYNILTQVHGANKWLVNVICCFCATSLNNNRKKRHFFFPPFFVVKHLKDIRRLFLTKRYLFFFFNLAACCQRFLPRFLFFFSCVFVTNPNFPPCFGIQWDGPARTDQAQRGLSQMKKKGWGSLSLLEQKRKHCVVRQSFFSLRPSDFFLISSRAKTTSVAGKKKKNECVSVCAHSLLFFVF